MPSRKSAAVSSSQWTESLGWTPCTCDALEAVESRSASPVSKIVKRVLVVMGKFPRRRILARAALSPPSATSSSRARRRIEGGCERRRSSGREGVASIFNVGAQPHTFQHRWNPLLGGTTAPTVSHENKGPSPLKLGSVSNIENKKGVI